jgi:hypothetical protein
MVSLGLAAVAASAGYLLGAPRSPPAVAAPHALDAARVSERAPVVVAGGGLSETDLRRVVKELAAAAPAPDKSPPAPAQPADPQAYDAGMQRVQRAIAQQQRWTQQDAIALDRELEGMSPEQRTGVLRTLVLAINRGELKLNYRGTPF